MPSTSGPGLKVLIEEARRRHDDTRPELLHLLVGSYFAATRHSAAEQSRFATLARRLIDDIEVEAALPIVRDIAPRPDLPPSLALHLARGPIHLAEPVLRLAVVLDDDALKTLSNTSPAHLAAIAARREVSPALAKQIAAVVHETREATPAVPVEAEAPEIVSTDVPESVEIKPAHIKPDYLAASPEDRAAIILRLVTLTPLPLSERVQAPDPAFTDDLLEAAKAGSPEIVARLLEQALGVTSENAARIVGDESGQAFAVAARALGLSFAILSRVLFRLHPVAGRSASDMTRLADMFDQLPNASAQHLVASWRSGKRIVKERASEDAPSMRSFNVGRPVTQPASEKNENRQQS
ncbi:MAG TPA: DUF2336 domain-containing protein [Ancylobacter sp.]